MTGGNSYGTYRTAAGPTSGNARKGAARGRPQRAGQEAAPLNEAAQRGQVTFAPDWKELAQHNGTQARYWRDLAVSYHQQLQALTQNRPESDKQKRISYIDRTGDTAAVRADRRK